MISEAVLTQCLVDNFGMNSMQKQADVYFKNNSQTSSQKHTANVSALNWCHFQRKYRTAKKVDYQLRHTDTKIQSAP